MLRSFFGLSLLAAWAGLIYPTGGRPPTIVFVGGLFIIVVVAAFVAADQDRGA